MVAFFLKISMGRGLAKPNTKATHICCRSTGMNTTTNMGVNTMLNVAELTSLTTTMVPGFGHAESPDGLTAATLIARHRCPIDAGRSILAGKSRSVGEFHLAP